MGRPCNKMKKLMDEGLTKSEEMLSINADYADFSNFLHQKTNVSFDSSKLLQDFYRLGDTYKCEVSSKKRCVMLSTHVISAL